MMQSEEAPVDHSLKLIIIGDAGAGKSSFMHRFLEGTFRKQSIQTIGVDCRNKMIVLDDQRIKLVIWDTAGQERYRAVTRAYYRGAHGALILYDTTSCESFANVPNWIQDAREQADCDIPIVVVGNKCDLSDQQQVMTADASRYTEEKGVMFRETSALTGENVTEAFMILVKRVLALGIGRTAANANPVVTRLEPQKKQESACCG